MVSFSCFFFSLLLWSEGGYGKSQQTVPSESYCFQETDPTHHIRHVTFSGIFVESLVTASPIQNTRLKMCGGPIKSKNRCNSSLSMLQRLRGGGTVEVSVPKPESELQKSPQDLVDDPGSLELSVLLGKLHSVPSFGLTETQVQERLQIFGKNELTKPPQRSIWALIAEQFQDRLVQILVVVALISAIFSALEHTADQSLLQSFVEPIVIVSILVLNAAVGVIQSQSAQDSLQALQELQPTLCTPIRGGVMQANMPASELVPGDIIQLRVGDKVPADARIVELQSSTLQVDETSLTGESVTIAKLSGKDGISEPGAPLQAQTGMVFAGTMITAGNAIAVCTSTGMNTEFGKIQQGVTEAQQELQKTPLGIKLDEFGDQLTVIIGIICVAVWLVSIPKMGGASFANRWDGAIYYAKVAVALGVAAIPEGLPAVITLCLSLGTRRMAQRNVLVRRLPSVETLGCTTVICTDKTGTLTTNEMTAVSLMTVEGKCQVVEHSIEGISYSPVGKVEGVDTEKELEQYPKGALADVAAVAALCNDASIIGNDDVNDTKTPGSSSIAIVEKIYERTGEPTEAALCVLAEKLGGMANNVRSGLAAPPSTLASANVDAWRTIHPRRATLEFNRDRKSMSVLSDFSHSGGKSMQNRLLVKGAANMVLDRCSHVKQRDGKVVKINPRLKRDLETKITQMATRPLRCLALAVKDTHDLPRSLQAFDGRDIGNNPLLRDPSKYRDIESGLTLVGIVGIKDPARPEVADSINECSKAGIRVMMITGDARDTAIAIAKDVNIFEKNADPVSLKAFEGREFFLKSEDEQLEILRKDNIVFCRAQPADKQKLVKMLQRLGEIPAMTGDGVNDAPALQQAAIGIAMGTGTAVSKEASDMVLADDNFSTIVSAVEEGRTIYANMQAFICFLISCNIGEICAIFFATLAGFPEPLTAMHLLWINLVTDGPPATALGFNPPSPDIMSAPPRPSDEPIMTRWLLTRYVLTGLYVGIATIGVFAQHYVQQGVSLSDLANWSRCGQAWIPSEGGAAMCSTLFRESGRMLPQTLSLTTLVCMEMLKALSAVSVNDSLFRVGPQSNKWLLLGVSGPFLLHLFVLYSTKFGVGGLGESFGMVPLSKENWSTVLFWALPILLVDEILKAIGRKINSESATTAK
ncbi:calcium-transporting ATPase [Nitzschia inconspicua]|uniref:Calcium-transporting ATPase n=1 Tax=Nitzschia inconspicua TaxID=303405 RepID=A0A9K3KXA6_9STRA|nr:calcium-transporting ATPase [Nitzschia inconspicua]